MTDEQKAFTEWYEQIAKVWSDIQRALRPIARIFRRLMAQIMRWIQQQGPLSLVLAYATPAMRRRAARQRSHVAMRAKNRKVR